MSGKVTEKIVLEMSINNLGVTSVDIYLCEGTGW